MTDEGWFADVDEEDPVGDYRWVPVLQVDGCCFPLPVWHKSREACERFIRESIIGKGVLP